MLQISCYIFISEGKETFAFLVIYYMVFIVRIGFTDYIAKSAKTVKVFSLVDFILYTIRRHNM